MARVNYQREKRLKDLDRQRKQEEKRTRKLQKDLDPAAGEPGVESLDPGATDAPAQAAETE